MYHTVYAAFMLVLIPILGTFLWRWQGSRGRLGIPTIWLECAGLTCSRRVGLGGAIKQSQNHNILFKYEREIWSRAPVISLLDYEVK